MLRRALRSSPTKNATDLTDEQWAAIAISRSEGDQKTGFVVS